MNRAPIRRPEGHNQLRTQQTDTDTERLWTFDLVLNLLTSHFLFSGYTAMLTIIPLYVLERGGEVWQTGLVVGAFGLISIPVRQLAGRWIANFGPKRVAVAGTAIFAVATLLHIFAFNVWLIIPARMVQGIGLAIGPVATASVIAVLAPSRRRAEGMSHNANAIAFANLYSPLLAFWLFSEFGSYAAFIYASCMALAGTVSALGLSSTRTAMPREPSASGGSEKAPLISRAAIFPTLIFLTYTTTTAPVGTFLPLIAEDRQLGNPGLYFTVNSIVQVFSLAGAGLIADRLGRGAVIVPGLLVVGAAMFVLMAATSQLMFILSGVLNGLGFGMIQPATQSLTVDRAPPNERSAALATLQQAWDVGGSGGAFIVGPLGSVIGAASTFGIAGAGTVLGALGYVAVTTRSRMKSSQRPQSGLGNRLTSERRIPDESSQSDGANSAGAGADHRSPSEGA